MKLTILAVTTAAITIGCLGAALPADWSQWEIKNSVARERNWLVIRQPGEGFCYMKQSYHSDPSKMEFVVGRERIPAVISPFYRGLRGNIIYQVDNNKRGTISTNSLKFDALIELPKDLMPQLQAGTSLKVRVVPKGQQPVTQSFSLSGFTAATKWLDKAICKKK